MICYWTCPDWLQGSSHSLVSGNLRLFPWGEGIKLSAHVLTLKCAAIPPVPYNTFYGMMLNEAEWHRNLHFRKQHKLERKNMGCFDMYVKVPAGGKQIWFFFLLDKSFSQAIQRQNALCTVHAYIYICTDTHTYLSHKYFRLLSGILNWIVFFTDNCGNVNTISTCDVSLLVPVSSACKAHNHAKSSCDSWIALIEQSKNFWRRKCTALVVLTVPQHSSTGKWTVDPSNALGAPRHTRNPK